MNKILIHINTLSPINFECFLIPYVYLTLSGQRFLSCRNQSIDLSNKSMDWFLYDKDIRSERVRRINCGI